MTNPMNYEQRESLRDVALKVNILKRVPPEERLALAVVLTAAFAEVNEAKMDELLAIPFPSPEDRAKMARNMLRDVLGDSAPAISSPVQGLSS